MEACARRSFATVTSADSSLLMSTELSVMISRLLLLLFLAIDIVGRLNDLDGSFALRLTAVLAVTNDDDEKTLLHQYQRHISQSSSLMRFIGGIAFSDLIHTIMGSKSYCVHSSTALR